MEAFEFSLLLSDIRDKLTTLTSEVLNLREQVASIKSQQDWILSAENEVSQLKQLAYFDV
ncbi:hypothetical protein [Synechococcus sp. PCC 6312]|uniref:hypothetical protein n=1 Tax=Synechococcus sp. (strain ATCC 27167 / PCC 6312) TaxID=195253 RepID=UPI00029F02C5|nr:hypothetical protein [Synechococcus sp. PCC 6312]AFY60381.1 hypothetical protein Syn6312_1196 [Synechococcus sp. PCC 6312]